MQFLQCLYYHLSALMAHLIILTCRRRRLPRGFVEQPLKQGPGDSGGEKSASQEHQMIMLRADVDFIIRHIKDDDIGGRQ